MDKEREGWEEKKEKKEEYIKTDKASMVNLIFSVYIKQLRGVVLPNIFQNGFSSTREAVLLEEPEPEPCQTGAYFY